MGADSQTLAVYADRARDYAEMTSEDQPFPALAAFIDAIPQGGRVLDLGCGPGAASAFMRDAGLQPDPVDASAEMIEIARERHGLNARLGTFDDLSGDEVYDGVWANFSLLHADRADLPRHLSAMARALRPGGLFHIGMKTGTGAQRDDLGRLYTYVTLPELSRMLSDAGLEVVSCTEGSEMGLAGTVDPYVLMQAQRPHG